MTDIIYPRDNPRIIIRDYRNRHVSDVREIESLNELPTTAIIRGFPITQFEFEISIYPEGGVIVSTNDKYKKPIEPDYGSSTVKVNDSDRPDWFDYEPTSGQVTLRNGSSENFQESDEMFSAVYECMSRALPVYYVINGSTEWVLQRYVTENSNNNIPIMSMDEPTKMYSIKHNPVEITIELVTLEKPRYQALLLARGRLGRPNEGSHPEFRLLSADIKREIIQ
jgi:hypothetical protein